MKNDRLSGGIVVPVKLYRWQALPTCSCIFIEQHNTETEEFNSLRVEQKCALHKTVADKDLYDVIIKNPDSEQKRVAALHVHLEKTFPELREQKFNSEGESTIDWKKGVAVMVNLEGEGSNRRVIFNIDATPAGITIDKAKMASVEAVTGA